MPPFINGLLTGLIFIFAIGPAFFALIQTSIQYGFRKAIFLALGISASDTFYVLLVLFGMSQVLQGEEVRFWMGVFGSILLAVFAVYSWFMKPPTYEGDDVATGSSYGRQFLKGLLFNGMNPLIIVFWATWIGTVTVRYEYVFGQQVQFFAGMLLMILSLDICKAIISQRLKHLITSRFIVRMNRVVAVILLLFTFRIVYFLFESYA